MRVTVEKLREAGVCDSWIEAFQRAFPSGSAEVNRTNFNKLLRVAAKNRGIKGYEAEDLYGFAGPFMGKQFSTLIWEYEGNNLIGAIRAEFRRRERKNAARRAK